MTGADTLGCLKSKIRCGWDQEDTDRLEVWIWLLCEDNMLKKSSVVKLRLRASSKGTVSPIQDLYRTIQDPPGVQAERAWNC